MDESSQQRGSHVANQSPKQNVTIFIATCEPSVVETDRDRVWAGVIQLSNEQAGFAVDDITAICEELYADDAPSETVVDDTVEAMVELETLEAVGADSDQPCYILSSDFDGS